MALTVACPNPECADYQVDKVIPDEWVATVEEAGATCAVCGERFSAAGVALRGDELP